MRNRVPVDPTIDYVNGEKYPFETYGQADPMIEPRSNHPVNEAMKPTNPAFRHHVESHNKYDTIRSRPPCQNCPICQAINAAENSFDRQISPENTRRNVPISNNQAETMNQATIENSQKADRQLSFFMELKNRGSNIARVIQDRVARHASELTVVAKENLEVLENSRRWWLCSNVAGESGYGPDVILRAINPAHTAMPAPDYVQQRRYYEY
jgi:hypothetical protein